MSVTNTLEIYILDKPFRVNCPPEEQEILRASASLLDKKMREVRTHSRISGLERIAVIVALNLSRELLTQTGGTATVDQDAIYQHWLNRMDSTLSAIDLKEPLS